MATYLYCVLAPPRTDAFPSELRGIAGAPVRAVVARARDGVEAWIATIDDSLLRATGRLLAEQALTHNSIVDAALATGRTPLPARFGSRFTDDAACISHLEQHHAELSAALTRVAGAVEMSLLLVPPNPGGESPTLPVRRSEPAAGRRYLEAVRERARSEERRRAVVDGMADHLTRAVAPLVRGEARHRGPSGVVAIAHLVGRDELEGYRRAVAGVSPERGLRIIVAGPRAPYSFAEKTPAVVGHDSSSPSNDE
jgi:gas vesicle protein GvpL/GvpF